MKILFVLFIVILGLVGCGRASHTIDSRVLTEYTPSPVVTTDEVQRVLDEENDYRLGAGQLPLTKGLTCSIHANLSTALTAFPTSLPSAAVTFTYIGQFNQPNSSASAGLNILPSMIRSLYTQWYAVRCTGQLIVVDSDYFLFSLTSDDASLLYIDNVKVVDNDGNHGSITKSGARHLKRGVHTIKLDYMQGPAGNQALILADQHGVIAADRFVR